MSDLEYCKMIEVPVNTCDVFIKPSKRKKRDVVEESVYSLFIISVSL